MEPIFSTSNQFTLLKFFHKPVLDKYGISFKEGKLICKFESDETCNDIKVAFEQINELSVYTLPLRDTENWDLSSCIDFNVCCIEVKNNKNFYGKTQSDIDKFVQRCQSSLKPERLALPRTDINESVSQVNEHGISDSTAVSKTNRNLPRQFSWSTHTKHCETFNTRENIIVKVYCADDILYVPVDYIVGNVNENLEHGVGVAKAKNKVARKDQVAVRDTSLMKHANHVQETAAHTKPHWSVHKPYQKTDVTNVTRYKHDTITAIVDSLKYADRNGMKTIAIPAISSGVHECPLKLLSEQYAKAILEYSRAGTGRLEEIHVVSQNKETVLEIQRVFREIITPSEKKASDKKADFSHKRQQDPKMEPGKGAMANQRYSGAHLESKTTKKQAICASSFEKQVRKTANAEYPFKCQKNPPHHKAQELTWWCLGPNQNLFIYTANLLSLTNIDMAVCGEATDGKGTGFVTKELAKIGGPTFRTEKTKAFVNAKEGEVILVKKCPKFPFVAHAILFQKVHCANETDRKEKVERIFSTIWKLMVINDCHSVALPLIGTGKGKADPVYYGERLINTLTEFVQENTVHKFDVHLVHIDKEKTNTAILVINDFFKNYQKPNLFLRSLSSEPCTMSQKKEMSWETFPIQDEIEPGIKMDRNSNYGNSKAGASRKHVDKEKEMTSKSLRSKPLNQNVSDITKPVKKWSSENKSGNDDETNLVTDDDEDKDCHVAAEKVSKLSVAERKAKEVESCVICMEEIKDATVLKCGHKFCLSCIKEQFKHKQTCPSCGYVCGIINGDQPEGEMFIYENNSASCAGYEKYGRIEIKYTFPDGVQKACHPSPGKHYKGITRTGFLPNNTAGKMVLEMLKVAFERKLIFTIGRSRTTGHEGVITWNDIHHKTDHRPNSQFGYPDPTYLDRVTDELAAKGVTPADIPSICRS